jgi:hypothetical protein
VIGITATPPTAEAAAGRSNAAERVWVYPYVDNAPSIPLFARAGFEPVATRVEVTSLGQVRAWEEPLGPSDEGAWEQASALASAAH